MFSLPSIQIEQQSAKIGIQTTFGSQSIRQPKATMNINTTKPHMDISSSSGTMKINQSRAWDALGRGDILPSLSRIYTQSLQIGIEGIGRIASKGDQLAQIPAGKNSIANIAKNEVTRDLSLQYTAPASVNNVDVQYRKNPSQIEAVLGEVDYYSRKNPPEMQHRPSQVAYHMIQKASLRIIPPQIDLRA